MGIKPNKNRGGLLVGWIGLSLLEQGGGLSSSHASLNTKPLGACASTVLRKAVGAHPASSGTSHTYQRFLLCSAKTFQILCCDSPKWLKQQFIFLIAGLEQLMLPFGMANALPRRLYFYSGTMLWLKALHLWMVSEVQPFLCSLSAWQNRWGLQAVFKEAEDHRCWLTRNWDNASGPESAGAWRKQRRSGRPQFRNRPESTFQFHLQGQAFSTEAWRASCKRCWILTSKSHNSS